MTPTAAHWGGSAVLKISTSKVVDALKVDEVLFTTTGLDMYHHHNFNYSSMLFVALYSYLSLCMPVPVVHFQCYLMYSYIW